MSLTRISLGSAGAAYVESQLQQGAGLCTLLMQRIKPDDTFFSPVPDGTTLKRAQEFEVGGLMSRHEMRTWLTSYLQASQASGGCAVIFHDVWAKPEDFLRDKPAVRRFFSGGSVFYFINKEIYDIDSMAAGIDQITSYLMIGIIVPSSIVASIDGEFADARLVEEIAQTSQSVFVSAYDQEGIVVWERKLQAPT